MATAFKLELVSKRERISTAAIHFTEKSVKALKATDERQEFKDAIAKGLFVIVQPKSGAISFQFRGRVNGEPTRKTLGRFPGTTLGEARDAVRDIQIVRKRGQVPVILAAPEPPKEEPKGATVAETFEFYMENEGNNRKSAKEKRRLFTKDIRPFIGDKAITSVTVADLESIVEAKFDAGHPITSNRIHSELSRLFNWSVTKGRRWSGMAADAVNPMSRVLKLSEERVRDRFLSERELGWFFRALPEAAPKKRKDDPRSSGDQFPSIFELLLRVVGRSADIHDLIVSEVQGDNLVMGETKNGQRHVVWLHPSAARLLEGRLEGKKDEEKVFSVWKNSAALTRLRKAMERLAAKEGETVPHWTLHDLRRTATSHMASFLDENHRQRILPIVRDKLLAHKEQGVIRHYDCWDYYAEKREALRIWNDWLDGLKAA